MRNTSERKFSARTERHRLVERAIALLLFALTLAVVWVVAHAADEEQSATCFATTPVDISLRHGVAATSAGPLTYYRFGRGEPLLLITGYRATVSEWSSAYLAALAAHREVIVMENPGVGASPWPQVPDTMRGMANVVSEFIDTTHLGKVDVLGWSMGGMVAQQLALSHPDQVKSLVLISTTPPGKAAQPPSAQVDAILSGHSPSSFDAIMGILFPPDARNRAIQCFRNEMFVPLDYAHVSVNEHVANAQSRAMSGWWHDERAAQALTHLAAPTLVVIGDDDEVLSPANSDMLVKLLPHATLDIVAGAGHALMYQNPSGLARTIVHFLDEQTSR
jgi:pimeloyl-ACP methyl ester carboxylesterase